MFQLDKQREHLHQLQQQVTEQQEQLQQQQHLQQQLLQQTLSSQQGENQHQVREATQKRENQNQVWKVTQKRGNQNQVREATFFFFMCISLCYSENHFCKCAANMYQLVQENSSPISEFRNLSSV